jgi:TPR repeat protein
MTKLKLFFAAALIAASFGAQAQDSVDRGMLALLKGDTDAALQVFRPLAQNGNAEAQYHLAYMYQSGTGVKQNDEEALKWYLKAAANGHQGANVQAQVLKRRFQ